MYCRARQFFGEFKRIFAAGSGYREYALGCYNDSGQFTRFITERINGIIEKMGCKSQNEYFRIDAIGYTSMRDLAGKKDFLEPQLWNLEIAVEHENEHKKWLDEVVKLAHISCPLRVVIGYVPASQRENGDMMRLEYVAEALGKLNCRENLRNGEFMIILGSSETKNEDKFFDYKAYVLDYGYFCFEELTL